MAGLTLPISSVKTLSPTLLTEYGTETVGGKSPLTSRYTDARPEETLMMRGRADFRRRGMSELQRRAMEVMLVLKMVLYVARRVWESEVGGAAMPALLIRTGRWMLVGFFYKLFVETLCVGAVPSNLANPLSTSRTKFCTLSSLVTSNSTAWKSARRPVSRRCATVFCAEWRVRAATRIVRSPRCWASNWTMPRPMPREEPVTRMIGEVMGC